MSTEVSETPGAALCRGGGASRDWHWTQCLLTPGKSKSPGIQHTGHGFRPVLADKHRFWAGWLPRRTASPLPSYAHPLQTWLSAFSLHPTATLSGFGIHPARSEGAAAATECSLGTAPSYLCSTNSLCQSSWALRNAHRKRLDYCHQLLDRHKYCNRYVRSL